MASKKRNEASLWLSETGRKMSLCTSTISCRVWIWSKTNRCYGHTRINS
jgi:hypothetical protein